MEMQMSRKGTAVDEKLESRVNVSLETPESQRPALTSTEAVTLAKECYGLNVISCEELPSYDDRNFRLCCDADGGMVEYLLKAHNSKDSANTDFIRAQDLAMDLLHKNDIPCNVPRALLNGDHIGFVDVPTHRSAVRLLTYIPGRTLPKQSQAKTMEHTYYGMVINTVSPLIVMTKALEGGSPDLLTNLGKFFARLDKVLGGFHHPALQRTDVWDVRRAATTIREHLPRDSFRRAVLLETVQRFEEQVLPFDEHLRLQAIHGDGNFDNILVSSSGLEVAGIVDFGDMVETWLVCELAILTAYVMASQSGGWDAKSQAAAYTAAGYVRELPLTDLEWEVLPLLVATRLALSLAMSSSTLENDPGNADYLMDDEQRVWETLLLLRSEPSRKLTWKFLCAAE